tara:strand:+ start:64 stop:696 length:633 start_codon:yes stop_codon:yes gene_type:complete
MWALVKAGQVIQIITFPKPMVINNIGYPKEIFTSYTKVELNKLGIYEVSSGTRPDSRFEKAGAITYTVDSKKGIVTEKITIKEKELEDKNELDDKGKEILDENGNKVVIKGLKSFYIELIKKSANSSLARSDWIVHRFVEDNTKKIPDDVKNYRKKVRDTSDTIITKIEATKTLSDLKKLFNDATIKDGKVTTPNTMDSLPESTIQEYER